MPPPSIPGRPPRTPSFPTSNGYTQLLRIFLLVLVAVTGIRLVVLYRTKRKRRTAMSYQHVQEKDPKSSPAPQEKDSRQDRHAQSKDQLPPTFRPIYPWTSPPQPLPGPYDTRFYPPPTLRRCSYDTSNVPHVETNTISYTRRVSTNSIPTRQSTLRGTVTTTSNGTTGWRRNQWVVSGG